MKWFTIIMLLSILIPLLFYSFDKDNQGISFETSDVTGKACVDSGGKIVDATIESCPKGMRLTGMIIDGEPGDACCK